jgi:hypothetical protein
MISNWTTLVGKGSKCTMGQRDGELLNLHIESSGR